MFQNKMWLLLDEEAKLKNMCKNSVAEVEQTGFLKVEENGAVCLKDQKAHRQFQSLLAGLPLLEDNGHTDTKIVSFEKGKSKIRMSACMLFSVQLGAIDKSKKRDSNKFSSLGDKSTIALIFSNVGMDKVKKAELLEHFDLTGQEQELAIALFEGESITEFAQKQQVSKETIRTRLKMLFEKTNTHRQIDIVRLVQEFVY